MKRREKELKFILNHYGYESQSRQLIEEMAELTQAINKRWRAVMCNSQTWKNKAQENIIEEIADVELCIEQIKLFLNCHTAVEKVKDFKVNRALTRIEKEKKNKKA